MNLLAFTGNLGGDAEVRMTPAGTSITTFSVALKSGWGKSEATTWMRCNLWGDRGTKLAEYLLKGQLVGITGEFSAREWTNKEGVVKTSCEVNVNDVTLLGSRDAPAQKSAAVPSQDHAQPPTDFANDDIPF
tara:strand:- start:891 stop:1286 length:396 start_codon:yes stop_codon:yes gene_type:complete